MHMKLLKWIDSLFYRYALGRVTRGLTKASWMSNDTHNRAVSNFVDNQIERIDLEYEAGDLNLQERHNKIRAIWKLSEVLRAS